MAQWIAAFMIGLALVAGSAQAENFEEVQRLYEAGAYDEATTLGEKLATADSYALAARSLLGQINLQTRKARKMKEINRAIELAESSLALDPDNVEAHLQIATAYGFKARLQSMMRAQMAGLPGKSRDHLLRAAELDPENVWARAFLGAWHWEVVRKGGAGMAKSMFDATAEEGSKDFEAALKLDPDNLIVPYLYALTLLTSDVIANEEAALSLLRKTQEIEAGSHQSKATKERAATLIRELEAGNHEKALELVAEYQGLKPLKLPKQ